MRVRDGDAAGEGFSVGVAHDTDGQRGFVHGFIERSRIEFDFAQHDIVIFLGRHDGEQVLALPQRARGNGQRINQVGLHEEKLPQPPAVEFHDPILPDIVLPDEQGGLAGIGRCAEAKVQLPRQWRIPGELLPFG